VHCGEHFSEFRVCGSRTRRRAEQPAALLGGLEEAVEVGEFGGEADALGQGL
jgi:hypothetical protein